MLKQIDKNEAFKRNLDGDDIRILVPGVLGEDWLAMTPDTLDRLLTDVLYFVDAQNTIDEPQNDSEYVPIADMVECATNVSETLTDEIEAIKPPIKETGRKFDFGKLKSLIDAGWCTDDLVREFHLKDKQALYQRKYEARKLGYEL